MKIINAENHAAFFLDIFNSSTIVETLTSNMDIADVNAPINSVKKKNKPKKRK